MNFPNVKCSIEISSIINPSEDPTKIQQAISNIFSYVTFKSTNSFVTAISKDLKSLEKINEVIHSKHLQKNYKRNLEKNLRDSTTWFYLNKQAAFVEKIAICENSDESPLGPIKVIVTSSKIDEIIDWLVICNDNF